jgi:hypothetical protein
LNLFPIAEECTHESRAPVAAAARVEFIESPDAAGTGGIDASTGLVLSHKWSARRALLHLDALDDADAAKKKLESLAEVSIVCENTDVMPCSSPDLEPRLWAVARQAVAQIVSNAAAFDSELAPPEQKSDNLSYELIGIDFLPDEDGRAWILEVQRHPSLLPSSSFDFRIKSGAVEAVHALLASAETEKGILPPAWTLCSIKQLTSSTGVDIPSYAPLPIISAEEIALWRIRAAVVSREIDEEFYNAECARKELYF